MTLSREVLLTILQAALSEPIGLLIRTSDTTRARAQLYKARADSADPSLDNLQIRTSPFPDGDLVICSSGAKRPSQKRASTTLDIGDLDLA